MDSFVIRFFILLFCFVSSAEAAKAPGQSYAVLPIGSVGDVQIWEFDHSTSISSAKKIFEALGVIRSGAKITKTVVQPLQNDTAAFILTDDARLNLVYASGKKVSYQTQFHAHDMTEFEDGVVVLDSTAHAGLGIYKIQWDGSFKNLFATNFITHLRKSFGDFYRVTFSGKNELILYTSQGYLLKIEHDFQYGIGWPQVLLSVNISSLLQKIPRKGFSLKVLDLLSGSDFVWMHLHLTSGVRNQADEYYFVALEWLAPQKFIRTSMVGFTPDVSFLDINHSGDTLVSAMGAEIAYEKALGSGPRIKKLNAFYPGDLDQYGMYFKKISDLTLDHSKEVLDWYIKGNALSQASFTLNKTASKVSLEVPVELKLGGDSHKIFWYEPSKIGDQMMRQVFGQLTQKPNEKIKDKKYFLDLINKELPKALSYKMTMQQFTEEVETTTTLRYYFKDLFYADPKGNDGAIAKIGMKYQNYGVVPVKSWETVVLEENEIDLIAEVLSLSQVVENGTLKCEAQLDPVLRSIFEKWITP